MRTRSGKQSTGWTRCVLILAVMIAAAGLVVAGGARPAKAAAGGTYSFAASALGVTEGQTVNVTVNRSGSTAAAAVCMSPTGASTAPTIDYNPTGQVALSFADGQMSKSFTFTALQDPTGSAANSGSRTVVYAFDAFPCLTHTGTTTAPTSVTITITDDDGAPTYSLGTSTYSVAENAGTLTIPITRSGIKTATDTVHCVISFGGANPAQPGDITGTTMDQTITFAPTVATQNCTIVIVSDAITESPDETLAVTLGTPSVGFTAGAIVAATVTIVDDDGTGTIQFAQSSYAVSEGVGTANIGVTRTNGSTGAASIQCSTTGGTATGGGTDYTTVTNQLLSWGNGDAATKYCSILITGDSTVEGTETITLGLTNVSGATAGAQTTATVNITDDDGTGTISFTSTNYAVAENGTSVTISVNRTGGSSGVATVDFATSNGTATTASSDYLANSGTLSWNNGESGTRTFSVTILDDVLIEGSETINLTLSNVTGGATPGSPSTAVITISDNESALPTITSLTPSAGPLAGGNTVTITGTNFLGATMVTFGGTLATNLQVWTANSITVTAPASPGFISQTVDVVVTTPSGSSPSGGVLDDYTYTTGPTVTLVSPNTGPAAGNTIVYITGTNFTPTGMTVTFGGTAAVFSYTSATTITAVSPAHSVGLFDVIVTTAAGSSPNTSLDDFTYTGTSVAVVSGVSPASGPVVTVVTVTGTGFLTTTGVTVGGVTAAFTIVSDTSLTVTIPATTPGGTVDIRVTNAGGTSANVAADNFTNTSSSGATTLIVLYFRWTLISWPGLDNISVNNAVHGIETGTANPNTNDVSAQVTAIWYWDGASQSYKGYFVGYENVPGANDFTTLRHEVSYWVAVAGSGNTNWTVLVGP